MTAGRRALVPIEIDRDEAREAARSELSDPIYRAAEPSWQQRVLDWIADRWQDLVDAAGTLAPGGMGGLLVLLLVVLGIVVLIRLRAGKPARAHRARHAVVGASTLTAEEHRGLAEAALAAGDIAGAITERFRAIVAELERRAILDAQPGRTADEAAEQAGVLLPGCAVMLRQASRIFDDVHYGDRPATRDGYQLLAQVDDAVRSERPLAGVAQ